MHEWCGDAAVRDIWVSRFPMEDFRENIFIIAPSTAIKMLKHCCNVTEVTLGICLNGDEVKEIVEKMEHLKKLEIFIAHSCQLSQSL